ncbi:MAG: Na+/H+ antiporter NhaC family protein [Saprospiraceae bacterium]|nr:Na+/H+ antiporter NhaC family protein [Saprospiraceae bacterium]MBK6566036.1 Na+/H+ antiporter NhaC family protein [Saprospiraceae bacterium]MBK8369946.1 Na+/H+ antiporter NhaC family protein [Saprospiraceae bacterium]MBK8548319.1 Na+/H+ antiporter NhaC family protein [Saprospiraceae bacterium]MBK8855857.1 Na+/H+ antiporter NhaC family protein [Saprospiraceae bacterium]
MFPSAEARNTNITLQDSVLQQPQDTFSSGLFEFVTEADNLYVKTEKDGIAQFMINGETFNIQSTKGRANFHEKIDHTGKLYLFQHNKQYKLFHISKKENSGYRIKTIPFMLSVLPPLIAILCALLLKEVLMSLFLGILSGVFIIGGLRLDSLYFFISSIWQPVQIHVVNALVNKGHMSIIVFSMLIGGMVALISKNGGMAGIVFKLAKYAKSNKSSQYVAWFLGVIVFFDDYANTLVVGNTMRPITDKFKVSREKLSYIVDSTAAPVAAVAFITTWIGAQLAYIQSGMAGLPLDLDVSPYALFFSSLKYAYYPFLTLGFMLLIIYTGREYGPMLAAERRALKGQVSSASDLNPDEPNMEDLNPVKGARLHWLKAALPVGTVIFVTIFGLMETGFTSVYNELFPSGGVFSWARVWSELHATMPADENGFFVKLGKVIGAADSYISLLWASMSGLIVAIIITLSDRTMKLFETMHWVTVGFKTMLPALLILTLAWALASVTESLHTADFISLALSGSILPVFMPAMVFILAFLVAFSTGSSWSTMAILYPIAIPAMYAVGVEAGLGNEELLTYIVHIISVVLAAAVFGDHCSPISDTTILSSLASDCNHLDHVKTQMPYAMTVGGVSLACCLVTSLFSYGFWFNLFIFGVAIAVMYGIIMTFGKKVITPE